MGLKRLLVWVVSGTFVLGSLACSAGVPQGTGGTNGETEAEVTGPTPPDMVKRGGTLKGTWRGTLSHLDLHQTGNAGTWNAGNLMYNSLIDWDAFDAKQRTMTPSLATSWQVDPSGIRFTFKLRDGVKFHDGAPLDAEQVVYNLKRIIDPPRGVTSARKEQFTMVDQIVAQDPSTVAITTKFPSANFMTLLADGWHVIMPKHILEKDQNALKMTGMGTGPYVFKELVPGQRFVAEKNPSYWRTGHPYLDRIELFRFNEETTVVAGLVTGQLDMTTPDGAGLNALNGKDVKATKPNMVVGSNPRLAIDIWRYNVTRPPLDKVGVRQALTLAIDKAEYLRFITGADGVIGSLVFPGSAWDLPKADQEKLIGYEPNMEDRTRRAKQLLAEAGLANGFTLTVMGSTGGGVPYEDEAQALETMWGKIGVKIKRDPLRSEEARQRETEGLFDVYVGGYGIATIDPVGVIGDHFLCGSGRNTSRYCNQELERLYEQQLKLLDDKERAKVVHEMVKLAVNDASMQVTNWNNEWFARWPYVRDHIVTPSRYTGVAKMEYVWLDK